MSSASPFRLSASDEAWVSKTLDGLSTDDRLRQLFVPLTIGDDLAAIERHGRFRPGGLFRGTGPNLADAHAATRRFLAMCEVPPFICGDLEAGANHAACMTSMQNQLGIAAMNDPDLSRQAVTVMAREASALGFNWTFTPCIDVNHATQSAIVGTRSYGSDVARIAAQAKICMEVMQAHGIATTAKHWPGEGYDQRDQHLLTTINPLSLEDWHRVFGTLYRGLIDGGIMSVMSAHIALPSYMAAKGVADSVERYRPAAISSLLTTDFLRGELGFQGVIVSDATLMAGLGSFGPRREMAPAMIAAGCDVFLFSHNEDEDKAHLELALRDGRLTEARLDDAVRRILTMKAALGLHRKSLDERILPLEDCQSRIKSATHREIAASVAAASVTLVKDVQGLLPLDVVRHRRITVIGGDIPGFLPGMPARHTKVLSDSLAARGHIVSAFDAAHPPTPECTDLVLYVMATESSLGRAHIYLDWLKLQPGMQNIMARYWHDIPCMLVSFGHPYFLYDAPRMPCVINAYSPIDDAQAAVAACMMGDAPFQGVSPVDAFAGVPDARF